MARVYSSNLSVKGLRELQKQLREYKNHILPNNVEYFVSELSKIGYDVAYKRRGQFQDYISVEKKLVNSKYNYKAKAIVIVFNSAQNIVEWMRGGQVVSAEVNSVLMAEYGSGQHARNGWRGTFPNQTHAFEDMWFWVDLEGKKHSSRGVEPTEPIYWAYINICLEVESVAKRCFER